MEEEKKKIYWIYGVVVKKYKMKCTRRKYSYGDLWSKGYILCQGHARWPCQPGTELTPGEGIRHKMEEYCHGG